MRAQETSRQWGELSRLRRFLVAKSELAVQGEINATRDANEAHSAALEDLASAKAEWQNHMHGQNLSLALVEAWRIQVVQTTGSAATAGDAVHAAEQRLSQARHSWLDAQRQRDLATSHYLTTQKAVRRKREDQALMNISDFVFQNRAQSR